MFGRSLTNILFGLLFVSYSAGKEQKVVRLDVDCNIETTTETYKVEQGECRDAKIVYIEDDMYPPTWLIVKVEDPFTLKYGSVSFDNFKETSKVSLTSFNLRYALGECYFDSTFFTAFVDRANLYLLARCGEVYGLLRSEILLNYFIYTPSRPLIRFPLERTSNTQVVGGGFSLNSTLDGYLSTYKPGELSQKIRQIHSINTTVTNNNSTAFGENPQFYGRRQNELYFSMKLKQKTFFLSERGPDKCPNISHNTVEYSIYGCMLTEVKDGPPKTFKWLSDLGQAGVDILGVDYGASFYKNEDIDTCQQTTDRNKRTMAVIIAITIFEMLNIISIITVVFICASCHKKNLGRKRVEQVKKAERIQKMKKKRRKRDGTTKETEQMESSKN